MTNNVPVRVTRCADLRYWKRVRKGLAWGNDASAKCTLPSCTNRYTYSVALDPDVAAYVGTVLGSPAMRAWERAAEEEVARERAAGRSADR